MSRGLAEQPEEQPSALEDSTFELVSNLSVLSEEDGRTVSVASQSVNGDLPDDFSSINSNVNYSSDEDEDATEDFDPDYFEYPPPPEHRPLSRLSHASGADVEDSGMTVTETQLQNLQPRAVAAQSPTKNQERHTWKRCTLTRRPKPGVWETLQTDWENFKGSPFMDYMKKLPWLWIVGLALANITIIYAGSLYLTGPLVRRIGAPFPSYDPDVCSSSASRMAWTAVSTTTLSSPTATPSYKGWIRNSVSATTKRHSAGDTAENATPDEAKMLAKDFEDRLTNLLASNLSQISLGHTLSTDFAEGQGFQLVRFGSNNGILIVYPPALASRDPPISVIVSRQNVRVESSFKKVRRGCKYLHIPEDEAHGKLDFLIKTERQPFHYQHQRVHFGSSWLPRAMAPAKLADAASQMVAAIQHDFLALEAVAKGLSAELGLSLVNGSRTLSRESKKFSESAMGHLSEAAKRMRNAHPPQMPKAVDEWVAKSKAVAIEMTKKSHHAAHAIKHKARVGQHMAQHAYRDFYDMVTKRTPNADLRLPFSDPALAWKNAQSNARDILNRITASAAGGKAGKASAKRPAHRLAKKKKKERKDERRKARR